MNRTLELIKGYNGVYDATLLINCLLGLLIIPKETAFERIPAITFDSIHEWGVKKESFKLFNKKTVTHLNQPNLKDIIHRLRNCVHISM